VTLGTALEVEVLSCGQSGPTRVEFFKGDRIIGTATTPPFRIVWKGMDRPGYVTLRAAATWADGATASATREVLLAPLMTEERVEVVNVYVTVQDRHGEYVEGLGVKDFRVSEDTVPQAITHFAVDELNLNVAFVLDTSYSMEGPKLQTARAALEKVVEHLSFPRDQAMLIGIQNVPVIKVEWTRDKAELLAGVSDLEARGNTALYDSVLVAARFLRGQDGRNVIVVLSDGLDVAGSSFNYRPGSVYSYSQVLDYAKRSDVMVYCVGLGPKLDRLYDVYTSMPLTKVLSGFSDETGGRTFFARKVSDLQGSFDGVVDDLRHQYSLGYTPSDTAGPGGWKEIRVELTTDPKKYHVNYRRGYYKPER
jgi:Ca-activated chloride channel family protein